MLLRYLLPATLIICMPGRTAAQDGLLDNSFNGTGKVIYDGGVYEDGEDIAVRPDGKLWVLAARVDTIETILLMRYNADGSLDNSFSGDGVEEFSEGTGNTFGACLLLQPDGKLLIGGSYDDFYTHALVLRADENGVLDPTFGTGGVLMSTGNTQETRVGRMGRQSDGTIVYVGNATYQVIPVVGSFSGTGQFDPFHEFFLCNDDDHFTSLCVTPDDRVFVTGYHGVDTLGFNYEALLLALRPDLTGDTTFSIGYICGQLDSYTPGIQYYNTGLPNYQTYDAGYDVVATPDGHLIMAGGNGHSRIELLKVDTHSAPDSTFGINGWVVTPIAQVGSRIALQPDGKIIVAGWTYDYHFMIARFNSDGSLDTGFGEQPGYTVTPLSTHHDFLRGLALQPDGREVVTGQVTDDANDDVGIVRYTGTAVGIHEAAGAEVAVNVYPVPCTGTFTVDVPDGARSITLCNDLGQVVQTIDAQQRRTFSMQVAKPGEYLLSMDTDAGRVMCKVVVLPAQ